MCQALDMYQALPNTKKNGSVVSAVTVRASKELQVGALAWASCTLTKSNF